MYVKQDKTETTTSTTKLAESTQKAASSAGAPTRLPTWTRAMGDHPPASLQAKLAVSQPHDSYEQKADRVADQVMRMPAPTGMSTMPEDTFLMRKESSETQTTQSVPPIVNQALSSGGQSLDASTRVSMGSRFGHDFSGVRVHTGEQAADSAGAIGARAYTVGRDVVFGVGQYKPETREGQRLLAHELTHVVQQDIGGVALQMSRLRDYFDSDLLHDPSRLSDAAIETTNEYRAYMDSRLVWQLELHVTREEALLACRLLLRAMRQGEPMSWEGRAREFVISARHQLGVATEASSMVGQQMTWVPSGPVTVPGKGNTFALWASASSETARPALDPATTINCWEMVLLAAHRADMVNWLWIHNLYVASVPDWGTFLVATLTRGSAVIYTPGDPHTPLPLRGDIVFFDGAAHVALATGTRDGLGRTQVISFWPPPGAASIPKTLDAVKITTIEELVSYMTPIWGAPPVTFARPPW